MTTGQSVAMVWRYRVDGRLWLLLGLLLLLLLLLRIEREQRRNGGASSLRGVVSTVAQHDGGHETRLQFGGGASPVVSHDGTVPFACRRFWRWRHGGFGWRRGKPRTIIDGDHLWVV